MEKQLGEAVAGLYKRLWPFFGSRDEIWSIVLQGERYPNIQVRVLKDYGGQKYIWRVSGSLSWYTVGTTHHAGELDMYLDKFVEEIKRKVKEGPSEDINR